METKPGVGVGEDLLARPGGWLAAAGPAPRAQVRAAETTTGAACPSVLDVARLESGHVNESERALITAHTRRCARCGASLTEIREARREILGANENATARQSRLAANEIQKVLLRRLD